VAQASLVLESQRALIGGCAFCVVLVFHISFPYQKVCSYACSMQFHVIDDICKYADMADVVAFCALTSSGRRRRSHR